MNNTNLPNHPLATPELRVMQKWSGVASWLLALSMIVAPLIYLVGDLRNAFGPFLYTLADALFGPVWGVSLVVSVLSLRARIGECAPLRASMALWAAILAAGAMIMVACIRFANRSYHLAHPELHLETSTLVLVVWGTTLAGITAAGWHFLGWALILLGAAGAKSGRIPPSLCVVYLIAGVFSICVFLIPNVEEVASTLGVIWATWQGVVLWKGAPEEKEK